MFPKKYLHELASAVSKRSGVSVATCEVVLPALFDEMRYMLCEGRYRCVTVESFGTLAVRERPPRHYKRVLPDGTTQNVHLDSHLVVKFSPTRNLRREVEASRFDPTRQSFVVHPDDHPLRTRKMIDYRPKKKKAIPMVGFVEKDKPNVCLPNQPIILRGKETEL